MCVCVCVCVHQIKREEHVCSVLAYPLDVAEELKGQLCAGYMAGVQDYHENESESVDLVACHPLMAFSCGRHCA